MEQKKVKIDLDTFSGLTVAVAAAVPVDSLITGAIDARFDCYIFKLSITRLTFQVV